MYVYMEFEDHSRLRKIIGVFFGPPGSRPQDPTDTLRHSFLRVKTTSFHSQRSYSFRRLNIGPYFNFLFSVSRLGFGPAYMGVPL